jgi:ribosomal protein S27E
MANPEPEHEVDCPLCGKTMKAKLGPSGVWYSLSCPSCMFRGFLHSNSPAIPATG